MRRANVFNNGIFAGTLTEVSSREYVFRYDNVYFVDPGLPAVSLTLPKSRQEYRAGRLFPFFANMLSEGANREVQARLHKLDPSDDFGILLATAAVDTPGSVTIRPCADDTI